jgi:ketosteroid isomerase-like protein
MPTLEERIQTLEDRNEINNLIANYCRGVDSRDEALFLSIWADDAKWLIGEPLGNPQGLGEIKRVLQTVWDILPESHHFTTNSVINVNGDMASAISDVDCTGTDKAGRALLIAAKYTDEYERISGTWKITQRRAEILYWAPVTDPWSSSPESHFKL